jgi:hypothetical protein
MKLSSECRLLFTAAITAAARTAIFGSAWKKNGEIMEKRAQRSTRNDRRCIIKMTETTQVDADILLPAREADSAVAVVTVCAPVFCANVMNDYIQ